MDLKALKLTPRREQFLKQMEIGSVEELLGFYPLRYEKVEAVPFDKWQLQDNVAVQGLICSAPVIVSLPGNRTVTKFSILAWNEQIQISLFNRPWRSAFPYGKEITVFGVYTRDHQITASSTNFHPLSEQTGLRPVYSLPNGMKQNDMKAIMDKALKHTDVLVEKVPERYRMKYRLIGKEQAIHQIHQPKDDNELLQAVRALKYEEFLSFQCALLYGGQSAMAVKQPRKYDPKVMEEAIARLPYPLTSGQQKALEEILADLSSDQVMFRLVQGDVGCGKTAVAALAIQACLSSGWQAVLMAPTEILARQHEQSLNKMGIECVLYTSSLNAAAKKEALDIMKSTRPIAVVGTHALFQDNVEFGKLGLVVADEQQRFGVKQRRALISKGIQADFLMMSATPIPRTYAHFLYGDIHLSSIHTLPPGRQPVLTKYIASSSMKPVLERILEGIEQEGRQVYVVCPSIEDNPEDTLKAAEKIYEGMVQVLGRRISIGLLHGKMKQEEKEAIMGQFSSGKLDVLVSTTVIEVGVDVGNATMMVIYDAHRFGLSTLHQLRGRTARGKLQGECYLLSNTKDPQARERLKKMEELKDGFSISAYDLQTRGPGDLLGTRQSGLPAFVLGDLGKDSRMMDVAHEDAKEILERNEDLAMLEYARQASLSSSYMD